MLFQGLANNMVHSVKYTLDPNIIDTGANILVAVQGTIATTGSAPNKLWRVNADEICTYDSYAPIVDIEFPLIVPVGPTASDVRAWGLKTPGMGNRGRIEFDITDAVFSLRPYDEAGTLLPVFSPTTGQALASNAFTWNVAWTATLTRFRIQVMGGRIDFLVNETVVGFANASVSALPAIAHHGHVINSNADNMDWQSLVLRNAFGM